MAWKEEPLKSSVKKGNIFGTASNRFYDLIFPKKEDIEEEEVKEMLLAYMLFVLIEEQTAIYGNTKNKGAIISKIVDAEEEDDKGYQLINKVIEGSFLFGKQVRQDVKSKGRFFENKEKF